MNTLAFCFICLAILGILSPIIRARLNYVSIYNDLEKFAELVARRDVPVLDLIILLEKNGLLNEGLNNVLEVAFVRVRDAVTWEEIVRADRAVSKATEEGLALLEPLETVVNENRYERVKRILDDIDTDLIWRRIELQRKVSRYNRLISCRMGRVLAWICRVYPYEVNFYIPLNADGSPRQPPFTKLVNVAPRRR